MIFIREQARYSDGERRVRRHYPNTNHKQRDVPGFRVSWLVSVGLVGMGNCVNSNRGGIQICGPQRSAKRTFDSNVRGSRNK